MDIERRFIDAAGIEVRKASPEAKAMTIRGYAAKFNSMSENLGGFREQIAPGAFADCLQDDVRALLNHDANFVLGRTVAGTCRIQQDDIGLAYEVDLPDTQAARDLMVSIDRGDISQSSFGFRVAPNGDTWDENEDGVIVRTITKVSRLYDVSPVTMPAYPEATVGMRSLDVWKATRQQLDAHKTELQRRHQARERLLRLF